MSLLQNEDLLIWQLRTSYLSNVKDNLAERLVSLNQGAIISNPSLRAAGYGADIEGYRTRSPPIPTATAIPVEYLAGPKMGISRTGTDEHEGGMATGRGSMDTVGPTSRIRRRRMREQHDEDDSSDLSEESDEEQEATMRAAQSIRFAKMPVRPRADSSPMRAPRDRSGSEPVAPEVFITHPTVRRTSSGHVDSAKPRPRRDTTTSSDMSSDNELDPSAAQRRRIETTRPRQNSNLQRSYTAGDDDSEPDSDQGEKPAKEDGRLSPAAAQVSDGSDWSSADEGGDSESLLDTEGRMLASQGSNDLLPPNFMEDGNRSSASPKKPKRSATPTLQPLPPPRPISQLPPVSALGQALKARLAKPKNPVEPFARFSGKGALDPLYIRIYAPFCKSLDGEPFDMPLQKLVQDSISGSTVSVTVADAIGLALWRYLEEKFTPEIPREKLDVNRWEMRMVDDGEVEYDFPPLQRSKNVVDFASNNTRPARGRGRGKAYDEFALVEASDAKFAENKKITPKYTKQFEEITEAANASPEKPAEKAVAVTSNPQTPEAILEENPLGANVPKPFAAGQRKGSFALADSPSVQNIHSMARTGAQKKLKIRFTSLEAQDFICTVEFQTDTYLAEVLDHVCRRWHLDKAHHYLRIAGTPVTAPLDRTVEALGPRSELDLHRRRFAGDMSTGLASSPSSTSPNAPLLVDTPGTPTKKNKKAGPNVPASATSTVHPLAQMQEALSTASSVKRYNVLRRYPMSLQPSHPRTILMDGEYLHMLPGEKDGGGKALFDDNAAAGKTTTVPFSLVVGSKVSRRHPKVFRVIIFRQSEQKQYDFQAGSANEAAEIVRDIQEKVRPYQGLGASKKKEHNWG